MTGEPFLGTGWRFPILPDASGRLSYAEGEDSIAQCLVVLLQTAVGDRVMRPDFGTQAPELVFAPGSEQNLRALEQTIRVAVRDFEPRVDLEEVQAEADPTAEFRVNVSIIYRIRRSNTKANLVFPFYLGVAAGTP
jgi:phage baseplate assembly protein W